MSCWEQGLWMGDVLADRDYALTVSDGVGSAVVNITKGSWWANAIVFWAWVEDQSGENLDLAVSFFAPQTVIFSSIGRTFTFDVDGSLVTEVAGLGEVTASDSWEAQGVFLPSYPVSQYDVGSVVTGASSVRTMTGRSTTVVGIVQPLRKIQMQFALGELTAWRSLWSTHFSKGRSCTFWHGDLPAAANTPFLEGLGAVDQLVVEPTIDQWRGARTVEYRNVVVRDTDPIDYRRRPNVPLSEPGLQAFYIPPTPAW